MKNTTDMQDFLKRVAQHNLDESRAFEVQNPGVDKILIRAETEGASGGSCWDEEAVEDYYISESAIQQEIESSLSSHLHQISAELRLDYEAVDRVCEKFSQNALGQEIATTTESEYYGNYSRYNLYSVDLGVLMSHVMSQEDFAIFANLLLMPNKKEVELFKSQRHSERQNLVLQIEALQSQLESFDKITQAKIAILEAPEVKGMPSPTVKTTPSTNSRYKV